MMIMQRVGASPLFNLCAGTEPCMDKAAGTRRKLASVRVCEDLDIYGERRDSERPADASCMHGEEHGHAGRELTA